MPFHRLYYHIVWATKNREPLIVAEIESAVCKAISDKVRSLGGRVFAVGGMEDHVHVAASFPPTVVLANAIGDVKGASSYHVNHAPNGEHRIAWQRGYGVLSFSRDHMDRIVQYIEGQKEHHRSGKLLRSLEECGEDDKRLPAAVREERAEYDPFGLADLADLGFETPGNGT